MIDLENKIKETTKFRKHNQTTVYQDLEDSYKRELELVKALHELRKDACKNCRNMGMPEQSENRDWRHPKAKDEWEDCHIYPETMDLLVRYSYRP